MASDVIDKTKAKTIANVANHPAITPCLPSFGPANTMITNETSGASQATSRRFGRTSIQRRVGCAHQKRGDLGPRAAPTWWAQPTLPLQFVCPIDVDRGVVVVVVQRN